MTTIQCTTQGVITAAERLCRRLNSDAGAFDDDPLGWTDYFKPTYPLLIQIADHPGVEGPQLWYGFGVNVGGHMHQTGWVCDVEKDGSLIYVDLDDLRD
jgi:hypothetical protein